MPRFSNAPEAMEHERAAQEVSPENSPGHPANAPVPDESPEPQSTPTASDESAGSTGDRTAERVREAMNQQGVSSTTENGVIVSRDSNGYVTVRNADSSSDGYGSKATYRSDGSVLRGNGGEAASAHSAEALAASPDTLVLATDGSLYSISSDNRVQRHENGHTYTISDEALLDSVRNAANSGDVSGISGITNSGIAAGVWGPGETGGSPTTHNVNDLNAAEAMASDAGYFREQIDDLPADPLERAIFLEQMAARARTVSGKWDAANVNVGFADDAGNPVDPKEYFLAVARRLDTFAAENREIGRSNRAGADAVAAFMAADAAASPLGIAPQPTDPEEVDRRGPTAAYIEAEGNLAATISNYERLATEWAGRAENDLVQVPLDGPGPSRTISPSEYFRMEADRRRRDLAGVSGDRRDAEQRADAVRAGITEFKADDAAIAGVLSREPQPSDPEEIDRRGTFGAYEEAQGNLRFAIGNNNDLVDKWRASPLNDVLQIPVTGEDGAVSMVTPARYFEMRQNALTQGLADVTGERLDLESSHRAAMAIPDESAIEHQAPRTRYFLPSYAGMDMPDGSSTLRELTGQQYADLLDENAEMKQQDEREIDLIRGNLRANIDKSEVGGLLSRASSAPNGRGVTSPITAALEERQIELERGNYATIDKVKETMPNSTDAEIKERVLIETVLDLQAWGIFDKPGSAQLESHLRDRGFSPNEAERYKEQAVSNGWATRVDLYLTAAGAGGGHMLSGVGRSIASKIPLGRVLGKVNPRWTRGTVGSGVEEIGEELGENIGQGIYTGDPVAVFLDPSTYVQSGASIVGSSLVEADGSVRPRPDSSQTAASGRGTTPQPFGTYQPAVITEGNRLLDQRAATRQELEAYFTSGPSSGVSPKMFSTRGRALARRLNELDTKIANFRDANRGLVIGYTGGGAAVSDSWTMTESGLTVINPADIQTVLPGAGRPALLSPGDSRFIVQTPRPAEYDPRRSTIATLSSGLVTIRPPSETSVPTQTQTQGDGRTSPQAPPGTTPPPGATPPSATPSDTSSPQTKSSPSATSTSTTTPRITPTPESERSPGRRPDGLAQPTTTTTPGSTPDYSPNAARMSSPNIALPTTSSPTVASIQTTGLAPSIRPNPTVTPAPATTPTVGPAPKPTPENTQPTEPEPEPTSTEPEPEPEPKPTTPKRTPTRSPSRTDDSPTRVVEPVKDAEGNTLYPQELQYVTHNLHTVSLVTGEEISRPLSRTNLNTFKVTRRGKEKLGGREVQGPNIDINHEGGTVSARQVPERSRPSVFRRDDAPPPAPAAADEFAYLDTPAPVMGSRARRRRRGRRREEEDLPTYDGGDITINVDSLL